MPATEKNRYGKFIRYGLLFLTVGLVGYNSVYIRNLDEMKAPAGARGFDAVQYAQSFWKEKLIPAISEAIDINHLVPLLRSNPDSAFATYSHALAIGNVRYFLIRATGKVNAIEDEYIITTTDSSRQTLRIATEYIFGNAVRDASGLIDINEFPNTMDFNNVSAEINAIIRLEVLPALKRDTKVGSQLAVTGAIELNQAHIDLDSLEIIPVQITIIK